MKEPANLAENLGSLLRKEREEAGLSRQDLADAIGLDLRSIQRYEIGQGLTITVLEMALRKCGMRLVVKAVRILPRSARNEEMRLMRTQGQTLEAIAQKFGVTRERVRQIATGIPVPVKERRHHCPVCGKAKKGPTTCLGCKPKKTHCVNGHDLAVVGLHRNGGHMMCAACNRERVRKSKESKKIEAATVVSATTPRDRVKQALEMYLAGKPTEEIERETGMTRYELNTARRYHGLPALRRRALSPQKKSRIKKLRQEGKTIDEVAAICSVAPTTVKRVVSGKR